jgi:ATP-dependent Clp protease ATP-binding subunit ClpX
MEGILTDLMFEIPSNEDMKNFIVTEEYAREKFDKLKLTHLKVA